MDGETYLIMDLLVELEDGSLANIEIQKNGYAFTEERLSCYAADLLMRQYTRVRGERGTDFTYRDIKKVYVIVLYEKSMAEFHRHGDAYFHHGKINYDTGLNLEMLDEYFLIALDVFAKIPYAEDNKSDLHAWLSLLTTATEHPALSVAGIRLSGTGPAAPQSGGGHRYVVRSIADFR